MELRVYLLLFFPWLAGAILDITLIANVQSLSHSDFFLSCVMGERDVSYLQIERENKIVMTHPKTGFQNYRNRSNHVQARGFSMPDLVGILYCMGRTPTEQAQVVYVHNSHNAHLFPVRATQSVNIAETATFSARVLKRKETDVMWKRNGTYYQTTDRGEVRGDLFTLTLPNVSVSENGVYSATFMGDSPLWSAFYRLIVRACTAKKWGPSCEKDCPDCLNGGVCHDHVGECICPPGFTGTRCERACREGQFGRNCQETCQRAQGCRGLSFCLPDPYGCSCASGWSGSRCNQACPPGYYGPDCALGCACRNGGSCNRFSGCVCPAGWHGQHCEKSDRFPQIIKLASELEFNLGSEPIISCVATGNPLPASDGVELRKADGTVLKLVKAIIEPGQITCEFQVRRLMKDDAGLWECRVSTTGGQDSRKVKVNIRVPPAPLSPPRLLAKQSRQLVVSPVDCFSGDGPIVSVKLLYKPKDDTSVWSSIVVDNSENITLMNLRPVTAYVVKVQLSRPGDGGEGSKGPEAVMVTECLEPTVKPVIEGWSIEEKNTLHVNWKLPSNHEPAHGFIVHLFDSARRLVWEKNITSISVLSARIADLEFNKEYGLEVLVYHCTSLGPPSDLYKVMINSKGPSSPRSLSAESVSDTAVRLSWQVPEYPNGGITKYIVELQQVGGTSEPQWIDTDNGAETTKTVGGLNASTTYQFRVRANSHVPGEWSQPVKAKTLGGRSAERAAQPGQPEHRAVGNRPAAALGHRRLRVRHLPHHPLCPPGALPHQEELFPPAPHLHVPVWLGECHLPRQDGVPSSPRPSPIQVTLHSLQSGCSQASPPRGEGRRDHPAVQLGDADADAPAQAAARAPQLPHPGVGGHQVRGYDRGGELRAGHQGHDQEGWLEDERSHQDAEGVCLRERPPGLCRGAGGAVQAGPSPQHHQLAGGL
ncbi:tyrosine-protein kinase receptor Tie-1 isoform X2 [Cygnus olor]|uniref:tyrosine-protein kinase receptor Tie-1 isoform X2 n=1 Tax=Cygnus olor TaxID=8869 RepID=UPI001ADE7412|nr:tyrosine-protein kinase receptor Tie-1 isoform X2 [Cygnus olor]